MNGFELVAQADLKGTNTVGIWYVNLVKNASQEL